MRNMEVADSRPFIMATLNAHLTPIQVDYVTDCFYRLRVAYKHPKRTHGVTFCRKWGIEYKTFPKFADEALRAARASFKVRTLDDLPIDFDGTK